MIRSALTAAACGLVALGTSATPVSPEDASSVLLAAGSETAEVTWLSEDIARIDGKYGDYFYSVRMMNCDSEAQCSTAMIFATFTMTGVPGLSTYEKINEYNDSLPFGRAFLLMSEVEDNYIVGVDYSLDLAHEHDLTKQDMELFMNILLQFTGHMSGNNDVNE